MSKRKLLQMVLIAIKQFRNPYYQGFAAQLAFYFLVSLIPIIILLSQVFGLFSVSITIMEVFITRHISPDVADLIADFLVSAPKAAMNAFFITVALWAASKVQFSLMRMVNYTEEEGQSVSRGFIRDTLKAVKTVGFTLFTAAFALIILIYGEPVFNLFMNTLYWALESQYTFNRKLLLARWPVAFSLYFFMVSYNYYALSHEKVKFRDGLPGSIFSTIVMIIATVSYSEYTKYVVKFDILYGALASAVALMFWFYFLSWALGLGVLFNKAWAGTK